MPEDVEIQEDQGVGAATADDEGIFEIVDESEGAKSEAPKPDATVETLAGLLKDSNARAEAAAKASETTTQSLSQGFAALGDSIRGLVASTQAKPGETLEAFEERVNKQVFDKPLAVMREVAQRESGPINEQLVRNQLRQGKKIATLEMDAADRDLFKRYDAEVEGVFDQIPIGERFRDPEGAYRQAFDITKARHLSEIIETERAKFTATTAAPAAAPKPSAAMPYGMVEGGQSRTAPPVGATPPKKTITLKAGQRGRIESYMKANNVEVTPKNFANVVESLHETGDLQYI